MALDVTPMDPMEAAILDAAFDLDERDARRRRQRERIESAWNWVYRLLAIAAAIYLAWSWVHGA